MCISKEYVQFSCSVVSDSLQSHENCPFPVLFLLLSFPKFAGILSAAVYCHHLLGFEIAQLEFCHVC